MQDKNRARSFAGKEINQDTRMFHYLKDGIIFEDHIMRQLYRVG